MHPRKISGMSLLIKIVLVAIAGYLSIGALLYFNQRRLMYHPERERTAPSVVGLPYISERTLKSEDGVEVIAWYGKAQPGQPTILYFHGNGGSLAGRAERIRRYMSFGRGFYIMSYRGFSGSGGSPSEPANISDAKLAYEDLRKAGVAASDIILYGESLGSGVAVQVAAAKPVAGIILDAPYTSIAAVAQLAYPWLPAGSLVWDRYDSLAKLGSVNSPLLIIHGEADTVIPISMGREIFAKANEPKFIATFPYAGHDDHYLYGSYDVIDAWIDRLRSGGLKPAVQERVEGPQ